MCKHIVALAGVPFRIRQGHVRKWKISDQESRIEELWKKSSLENDPFSKWCALAEHFRTKSDVRFQRKKINIHRIYHPEIRRSHAQLSCEIKRFQILTNLFFGHFFPILFISYEYVFVFIPFSLSPSLSVSYLVLYIFCFSWFGYDLCHALAPHGFRPPHTPSNSHVVSLFPFAWLHQWIAQSLRHREKRKCDGQKYVYIIINKCY